MRNNESGIIATVKMSHKGKSYQASSIVSWLLPTAITVSQQETGHSAGISFTSQLMHQTQSLLLETWQGHYNSSSFPFSYLPVLDEELPPGVTCICCRSNFTWVQHCVNPTFNEMSLVLTSLLLNLIHSIMFWGIGMASNLCQML